MKNTPPRSPRLSFDASTVPTRAAGFSFAKLAAVVCAVLFCCAVLLPPATAHAQDTTADADAQADTGAVALRPAWVTGQTTRYEFWSKRRQDITVTFGDRTQSQGSTVESTGELSWVVDRVKADGGAVCTMTLTWMTAELKPDEGDVSRNDSRKGKGDTEFIHDLLKAMAGKPITVTINADGSVAKVEGVSAMRDACKNPDMVPEPVDFEETASDLASLPFAPEVAEVGDTWTADFRWSHETGFLDQTWKYTLSMIEDIAGVRIAVVDGVVKKMKLDPSKLRDEMPDDAPPVKVKLLKHQGESQVLFDLTRHEAVGRNGVAGTTVSIEIPLPDGRKITRTIQESTQSQVLRIAEE